MNNPVKNVSVLKIARNMGDVAITALEVYKTILSVKIFAADSLLKTVKLVKNNTAKSAPAAKAQLNPDTNPNNTENVKDNAKDISNNQGANGKIKITSIKTMPNAKAMSDRFPMEKSPCLMSAEEGIEPILTGSLAIYDTLSEIVRCGGNFCSFFHVLF